MTDPSGGAGLRGGDAEQARSTASVSVLDMPATLRPGRRAVIVARTEPAPGQHGTCWTAPPRL